LEFLIDSLKASGGFWFYFIVFISALAENLFTPLPGDSVTVFGAYLAGKAQLSLTGVFISSSAGGTLGFMGLYTLGRLLHRRAQRREKIMGVKFDVVENIRRKFKKWGYLIILFNRFIYGLRFAIAVFAGIVKLPWLKVLIFSFVGTILWNSVLVYIGGTLGENWDQFRDVLWKYNRFFIAGMIIIIVTAAFIKYYPRLARKGK